VAALVGPGGIDLISDRHDRDEQAAWAQLLDPQRRLYRK
jgi:hypothetical protein